MIINNENIKKISYKRILATIILSPLLTSLIFSSVMFILYLPPSDSGIFFKLLIIYSLASTSSFAISAALLGIIIFEYNQIKNIFCYLFFGTASAGLWPYIVAPQHAGYETVSYGISGGFIFALCSWFIMTYKRPDLKNTETPP